MNLDWQIVIVWLVILFAAAYILRRALIRVRGMNDKKSCAVGCGCSVPMKTGQAAPLVKLTRKSNVA